MSPFDRLMNRVDNCSDSTSFFKSQIGTRLTLGVGGIPLELLASVQNIIKLPFQVALATLKVPVKIINFALGSPTLKEYDHKLPGLLSLAKTVLKTIGYAIGTLFTATLGLILSPHKNYRLHVLFGLVTDMKAQQARQKLELEAVKQRESQREIMHLHIRNLIHAQRLKIAEKERQIAQQALQRKELEELAKREFKLPAKPDESAPLFGTIPPGQPSTMLLKSATENPAFSRTSPTTPKDPPNEPLEVKMAAPEAVQPPVHASFFGRLFKPKTHNVKVAT